MTVLLFILKQGEGFFALTLVHLQNKSVKLVIRQKNTNMDYTNSEYIIQWNQIKRQLLVAHICKRLIKSSKTISGGIY